MKIGVFDSGMGGLIIARSLIRELPDYDYVFLGDTARVPYGNRSSSIVHEYTLEGVKFLFSQGCQLVILACNTASAEALRRIQREYLPNSYPDRRVLGVLIPAVEAAVDATGSGVVGVIGTSGTVASGAYRSEISKLNPNTKVVQKAAPLLVPLVEYGGEKWSQPILEDYLKPLLSNGIDTLVLACTHYPALKDQITKIVGSDVNLISQDEIIASKLKEYLNRHPDLEQGLSRNQSRRYLITDKTEANQAFAERIFGSPVELEQVDID